MPLGLPSGLQAWGGRLNEIGFERTPRALAALSLSLFITLYLRWRSTRPRGSEPPCSRLAACYARRLRARWSPSGSGGAGSRRASAYHGILAGDLMRSFMLGGRQSRHLRWRCTLLMVAALMGKQDGRPLRHARGLADRDTGWTTSVSPACGRPLRARLLRFRASIVWALGPQESAAAGAAGALRRWRWRPPGLRGLVRMRSWGTRRPGGARPLAVPVSTMSRPTGTAFPGHLGVTAGRAIPRPRSLSALLAGAVIPFAAPLPASSPLRLPPPTPQAATA